MGKMISLNYSDSQVNRFPDGTVIVLTENKPPLYFTGVDAQAIWAEFQKLRDPYSEAQGLKITVSIEIPREVGEFVGT
jgi:hypothetical protein